MHLYVCAGPRLPIEDAPLPGISPPRRSPFKGGAGVLVVVGGGRVLVKVVNAVIHFFNLQKIGFN